MNASGKRIIAHFDLDAFFVSVERLFNPSYIGIPLVVGGRERGVVSTCSYEARQYGVRSAMPVQQAKRLCPHATFIKGNIAAYSHYSRMVTAIIAEEAPVFEKASIDEFYVDLTGMDRFFDPFQWTIDLREKIIRETRLPISFGLASSKMVAKIATDSAKPNGYLHVPFGKEKEFLAPLHVSKIHGVGKSTQHELSLMGIQTIRDITETPASLLEKQLGKYGLDLWNRAHGIHTSPVTPYHEAKSISTERTFGENVTDVDRLLAELVTMTERVGFELRKDNKMAGCVAVKIRYPNFDTFSKQTSITYSCYDDEFIPLAKELFHQLYKKGQPVRLLGVRLSELTNDARQTNLFYNTEKKADLYKAIDDVKNKFGKQALKRGGGKP